MADQFAGLVVGIAGDGAPARSADAQGERRFAYLPNPASLRGCRNVVYVRVGL
jgi:hypothetical protein